MGEQTKIQWTHHTFNPWWGCAKVSPGCKHCYAETFAKRTGHQVWGVGGPRRFFAEKHWNEPLKWAREAAKAGERRRVFCASMADVFEDHPALEAERLKLWTLIRGTAVVCPAGCDFGDLQLQVDQLGRRKCNACLGPVGGLDWLLLTKRPENVIRFAPADILPLVWVGTTVEDQEHAEKRIPELLRVPARVRFLSCEPLLGPVDLNAVPALPGPCAPSASGRGIAWVIVGGESGPGARPFDLQWARSIRKQCADNHVACFVKQLGADPFDSAYDSNVELGPSIALTDPKGGNADEWPEDLRVRQFPEVRHA